MFVRWTLALQLVLHSFFSLTIGILDDDILYDLKWQPELTSVERMSNALPGKTSGSSLVLADRNGSKYRFPFGEKGKVFLRFTDHSNGRRGENEDEPRETKRLDRIFRSQRTWFSPTKRIFFFKIFIQKNFAPTE